MTYSAKIPLLSSVSILNTEAKANMRTKPTRPAAICVELALCAPIVCFALVALADLALVGLTASNVQTTTSAATTLCSQAKANCKEDTIRQVCNVPNDWTISVSTAKSNAKDAYGQWIYTANITISAPYTWMTPFVSDMVSSDQSNLPNYITRNATTPIINPPPD